MDVADDEWHGMILFGLSTARRLGNIVALTWQNLGTDRKETRFTSRPFLWLILTAFTALLAGQEPSQSAPTVTQPPGTNDQFAGPSPVAEAVTKHRFACTDYTQGKVFIVSSEGAVEWEYPAEHCNDLSVLPNGDLLFNTGHGVKEVTREKNVVFNYESSSAIYACQRLPDGNTFIGECDSGRLLEVSPAGLIVKEVRLLPAGQNGGPAYMRNARRLNDGHYLVAHYGADVVREYDDQGKVVREIPAPGGPHSVERLTDGHTLISCGDHPGGPRIFETDDAGKTVWEVRGGDLPGVSLKFIAGFQRLPNGNILLANWLGHEKSAQAPQLVEVTPDKRVAWTFTGHEAMRTISNVRLLDAADEPALKAVIITNPLVAKVRNAALAIQRHSWEQGVLAVAFLEEGDDALVVQMAKASLIYKSKNGVPAATGGSPVDPLMAGEAIWRAAQITGDPELKQAVSNSLDYALKTAPRAADGTVYHAGETFWSDTFHTTPPFLACAGQFDEAIRQIEGLRKRLWNPEAKLLAHIWDERKGQFQDKKFWGGGQGWAAAALTRVIRALPADRQADKSKLAGYLKDLIDGCLAHQRDSGLFNDVVDDPGTFEETNLAQMLVYSIYESVRGGWLPSSYLAAAERMRSAAQARVDNDGFVRGVCGAPQFNQPGISAEGQAFFLMMEAAAGKLHQSPGR
jgi:unsaturated rhamnogalacturonyl hydrolase